MGAGEVKASGCSLERRWTGEGDRKVEPDGLGGGLQDGQDTIGRTGVGGEGDTTLGGSCVDTLGRPGIGIQGGWKEEGASGRHDSKIKDVLKVGNGFNLGDACGLGCTSECPRCLLGH